MNTDDEAPPRDTLDLGQSARDESFDATGQTIPLSVLAREQGYEFTLTTPEHPDVRVARLRREEAEDQHRRQVFWVVLGVLILAGVAVFAILFNSDASTETQAWARNVASAIVGGIVGYFTGSAGKASR